jgi:hypothetical protein
MLTDAPLADQRQAVAGCPRCGSASFKRLKAERGAKLTNDRECKECGLSYMTIPAPASVVVEVAMYAVGVVFILSGILAIGIRLAATQGPDGVRPAGYAPVSGFVVTIAGGIGILSTPSRLRQFREERLQRYRESAAPGAPPPVELPKPTDMVFLSIFLGAMALAAPLATSLLTVVAFGPAAVVCGVIALTQGHLKGLIGLVLGVVGLIVWGFVFGYLVPG